MWPNPQEAEDLVTFTKEILNGKDHLLHGMIIAGLPKLTEEIFKANVWADKMSHFFLLIS